MWTCKCLPFSALFQLLLVGIQDCQEWVVSHAHITVAASSHNSQHRYLSTNCYSHSIELTSYTLAAGQC